MKSISKAIQEEFPKIERDLELFKSYDQNLIPGKKNSDILDLLSDLMPKSTEGKILLGALIALGLWGLSKK